MSEPLPANIVRQISTYSPVVVDNLTLYPIKVASYYDFLNARPAIEFLQQSLSPQYLSLPLLSAFFKLDFDAITGQQPPIGLFRRAVEFLCLSLRLGEGQSMNDRVKRFTPSVDPKNPSRLKFLAFTTDDGDTEVITPIQFSKIRPIIAAQNGIELLSDDANPELVQADRDVASAKMPNLNVNLEDMIATVATLTREDEAAIYEWPILKMDKRRNALERAFKFLACAIGETQGSKWKGGNPHPSLFFDRLPDEAGSLIDLKSYVGGAGMDAVERAGGIPSAVLPKLQEKE